MLQMIHLSQESITHDSNTKQCDEQALIVFDTLHPATETAATETICLAEDGMPYIESPLDCNTEECFVL